METVTLTAPRTLTDSLREQYRYITGAPVEGDLRPYLEPLAAIDAIDLTGLSDDDLRSAGATGPR